MLWEILPDILEQEAEVLFHGTSAAAAAVIAVAGLKPMTRQFVHLSTDRATAVQVGLRKAFDPVVLCIDAAAAHAEGVPFWVGNESVWLAAGVPAAFIAFN